MRFQLFYFLKIKTKFVHKKENIFAKDAEQANEIALKILPKDVHIYSLGLYYNPSYIDLMDKGLVCKTKKPEKLLNPVDIYREHSDSKLKYE